VLLQPNGEAVTLLDDYASYAPRPDPEFSEEEVQVCVCGGGGAVYAARHMVALLLHAAACCCMLLHAAAWRLLQAPAWGMIT
jgi:hypothetical protein